MRILNSNFKKERGVILVTVIILTIVLSVVAVGVMSLNVSQIKTGATVVESVTAEQLATGIFYQDYQRRIDGNGTSPTSFVIGTKTYSISRAPDSAGAGNGPNQTNQLQFNLTY